MDGWMDERSEGRTDQLFAIIHGLVRPVGILAKSVFYTLNSIAGLAPCPVHRT